MIIKTVPVYTCEHCKRKMFRRHSMVSHEKWCTSNPSNIKACSNCSFIESVEHEYYTDGDYGDNRVRTNKFHCKALDKFMYPMKAERKGLVEKYPATFEDQVPMPKYCNSFKSAWDNEFEF